MSTFYSPYHRLIFIHVPKCAGTTITSAILFAVNRGIPSPDLRLRHRGAHPFAAEVRRQVGRKDWARCWTFGVVRNPWDRMVSLHGFLRDRELLDGEVSFRSWLLFDSSDAHKKAVPQCHWLYDGRRQIVDSVFRFERLDRAQKALSEHLQQPVVFNWYKKTDHGDYQSHYDEGTREWVRKAYAEDIERFGYEF